MLSAKRLSSNTCNINFNNTNRTQPTANVHNETSNEDSSINQLLFHSSNQQVF